MAERLTALTIRAFRGVPGELPIEFGNGRSIVILGDNGTGKSTIADALEFYFTGQIRSLAREGRKIIHHQSADPDAAVVEVGTTGTLGGRATRSEFVAAARALGARENILLTGRTLAEFVEKTKGEKWHYVFEILGRGVLDLLRRDLQQARNMLERDRVQAEALRDSAASGLRPRCPELTEAGLFAAIVESCHRAGVAVPASLDLAMQQDWAAALRGRTNAVLRAAPYRELIEEIGAPPPMPSITLLKDWNNQAGTIDGEAVTRVDLLDAARLHLHRIDGPDACPLCGQAVEAAAFRRRILDGLTDLRTSSRRTELARRTLQKYIDGIGAAVRHRRDIARRASKLRLRLSDLPPDPANRLQTNYERVITLEIDAVQAQIRRFGDWDDAAVKLVREAAPQVSPQDDEVLNLVRLVDAGRHWLQAEAALRQAQRAVRLAARIYDAYASHINAYMSDVLSRISDRVASIYGYLHPGESLRNITVETWGDKGVELAVEFHGVRQRPPHGVLSESHLNSLGIALFLAMAEAFNDQLGFLVLDDVVNSFDIGHRGRLAELLAFEYQDRQLIVLTHDRLFYERLRRQAPQWRTLEFTSWTYEEGPRRTGYDVDGFLGKARDALEAGDLQGAASKSRRALEELLQEACEGIGAALAFRRGIRNDRREAGELLAGIRRAFKANGGATIELNELLKGVDADLQAALNVEAHAAIDWVSPTEVADALDRIKKLEQQWTCGSCSTRMWTLGDPPHTRCRCGHSTFPSRAAG